MKSLSVMYAEAHLGLVARGVWAAFLRGDRVRVEGVDGVVYLDRGDPRGIWRAA